MYPGPEIINPSKNLEKSTVKRLLKYYKNYYEPMDIVSFYKNSEIQLEIVDEITGYIDSNKIIIISFDVFDTLLLREQKSEIQRFFEISRNFMEPLEGTEIQTQSAACDALFARLFAMRSVYNMSLVEKGNRAEKFTEISRITCELLLEENHIEDYIENEIVYEANSLTLNPIVHKLISAFPNIQPIFVSDMYLSKSQIHRIMSKYLHVEESQIFSSSDGNGSKRTGRIFPYLEALLKTNGRNILHLGDNLTSDYIKPREAGWNAMYLPIPDYEKQRRWQSYQHVAEKISNINIDLKKHIYFNY